MKKTSLLLLANLSLWGAVRARASDLSSQLALEERFEDRISRVVHRYDPIADVRVDISFRKLSSPLPGTALDLKNFQEADIEKIDVAIQMSKFPAPDWLKTQVNAKLNLPDVDKRVDFQAMSDAMRKDLEPIAVEERDKDRPSTIAEESIRKYSILVDGVADALAWKLMACAAAVALLLSAVGSWVLTSIARRRSKETATVLDKVIPAVQSIGNIGGKISASFKLEGGAPGAGPAAAGPNVSGPAASDVEGLPAHALEDLFADCYWCRRDRYAAWLWSVMSPDQRLALFQSPKVESDYLKFIQSLRKDRGDDHLDPVYLTPLGLHHVSQDDLARWVRSHPGAWHSLSPMRQLTIPLSLQERLSCIVEPVVAKLPALPDRQSPKRPLEVIKRLGDLTPEDEATLLHNPGFVPEAMRSSLKSLAWLALKPFEVRQKALNDWSAEDLASAWIGTPEVLARLAEALPEKKRAVLDSYLGTVAPSRENEVYRALVEEGLKGSAGTSGLKLAA
jgi:hypothetical protein